MDSGSFSSNQQIPCECGTQRLITVTTEVHHLTLPESVTEFTYSLTIYQR